MCTLTSRDFSYLWTEPTVCPFPGLLPHNNVDFRKSLLPVKKEITEITENTVSDRYDITFNYTNCLLGTSVVKVDKIIISQNF